MKNKSDFNWKFPPEGRMRIGNDVKKCDFNDGGECTEKLYKTKE